MLKLNKKQKQMLKGTDIVKMSHQARIKVADRLKDAESVNTTGPIKNLMQTPEK